MIDNDGFRLNVGIILCNEQGKLFWAKRIGQNAWQFPQGGILTDETPMDAMYRELAEEVGLRPKDVDIIGCTSRWLRYRLPGYMIRRHNTPMCIGQKQLWYMLRLLSEDNVRFDLTDSPEFDSWRWVNYWHPLREVVFFKRQVYALALKELAPCIRQHYNCASPHSQSRRTSFKNRHPAFRINLTP